MSHPSVPSAGGASASAGRIELHTHLEGSLTPERLIALAGKYGQSGLAAECLDETGTRFVFDGFLGFLNLYKRITRLLQTPGDHHALALDLGQQLAADDVIYAEVSVSYGVLLKRARDPRPIQAALAEAAAEVRDTRGVQMRWIPDATRQWGRDEAWRAWEAAASCGRDLGVVGFGLGGDESAGPAGDFADLFAEVKAEGLGVTIHAGEVPTMGPAAADSVRQAVETCGADRIGHGVAAAGDPSVMALLAARGVFVEACPGSNLMTGALADLGEHPLPHFLAAGIPCGINTDDRTLFGVTLEGEIAACTAAFDLTDDDLAGMTKAARQAAFDQSSF
jgi:adenosine deaminase